LDGTNTAGGEMTKHTSGGESAVLIDVVVGDGFSILMPAYDMATDSGVFNVSDVAFKSIHLDELVSALRSVGERVRDGVATLRPSSVECKVGIGIDAKTGKLVALFGEASVSAAIEVVLKWEREP
jgi:hypothetical protein